MMETGDDAGFPEPICHVHHMDLISDPAATVEAVYWHFGLPFPPGGVTAIEQYTAARPNGGYGGRDYGFADHGLDEAAERKRFRPYMLRFGIATEVASNRRRPERQSPERTRAPAP